MAYKLINPHEPHPHGPRLRKPTEEEMRIIENRRIMVHEKMLMVYTEEELDRLTFKPNK